MPPEPIPLAITCDREGSVLAEAVVALAETLINMPELDSEDVAGSLLVLRQAANSLDLTGQRLDNVIITSSDDEFVEVAADVSFALSETAAALEGFADAVAASDVTALNAAADRLALDTGSLVDPSAAWFLENCPGLGIQVVEDLAELGN